MLLQSSRKQIKLDEKRCKALDLRKKQKAPRVSSLLQQLDFDQEKWAWHTSLVVALMFPRQLLKAIIVVHVNELKSFKISKSMIKRKTWMRKKKVSCECSGSILKNRTNYCDKKQKTVYSSERFRKSLRSFNEKKERKEITTSDSRAAISSSAPPKWRKTTKKIEIESVFHVFSTTLQKDELFSFWWPYLCPLALPPHLNL